MKLFFFSLVLICVQASMAEGQDLTLNVGIDQRIWKVEANGVTRLVFKPEISNTTDTEQYISIYFYPDTEFYNGKGRIFNGMGTNMPAAIDDSSIVDLKPHERFTFSYDGDLTRREDKFFLSIINKKTNFFSTTILPSGKYELVFTLKSYIPSNVPNSLNRAHIWEGKVTSLPQAITVGP